MLAVYMLMREASGGAVMISLLVIIEGVCGIRPQVTLDVMLNSLFVSQANTRQFGRRI